jgi:hypothetical protein
LALLIILKTEKPISPTPKAISPIASSGNFIFGFSVKFRGGSVAGGLGKTVLSPKTASSGVFNGVGLGVGVGFGEGVRAGVGDGDGVLLGIGVEVGLLVGERVGDGDGVGKFNATKIALLSE